MMFAVAVQNTETDELDMFGPYDTWDDAAKAASEYRRRMDEPYDFTDVFSVWPINIRTMEQSMLAHKSLIDMYLRLDPESRTLDNPMGLDQ
jgi:hypothetical protein